MMTTSNTQANKKKVVQLEMALSELLAVALRRGFHGSAGVEVTVQDGTIQNIARRMERIER